jgi:putative transposase
MENFLFLQQMVVVLGIHPQACKFLKLKHIIFIQDMKKASNIERIIQYIKDRVEDFDDYFPCIRDKCNLQHVINWFNAFTYYYNNEIIP